MITIKLYEKIKNSSVFKKVADFQEFDYKTFIKDYKPAFEIVGIKIYLKEVD